MEGRQIGPTKAEYDKASATICPTCKAEPGKPCIQQRVHPGDVRVRFHPHRYDAAKGRHTPRQIAGGVWDGNFIRRARKAGRCEFTRCNKRIEKGDEYFEGEGDPGGAGGFRLERYCMDHLSEGDTMFFNRETGETTAPCPQGCAGNDTIESCQTCHGTGVITVEG